MYDLAEMESVDQVASLTLGILSHISEVGIFLQTLR